jgi:precorrin-4/cobalt-precorrin-4 C11-methyltransferase
MSGTAGHQPACISFVGAGPGAADLLTMRAVDRLRRADVVVWAASLVDEAVLDHCRAGAVCHDSKSMTLAQVLAVYAEHPEARIVRVHSGDPSVFSTIGEQIDWCRTNDRSFEIVPGVTSVAAAAAAARGGRPAPPVSPTLVMTRLAHRTSASMPAAQRIETLAQTGPTMAVFLSAARPRDLQEALLAAPSAYRADTPAVVAVRASWPDEVLERTTVGALADTLTRIGATTTTMVLVGDALAGAATRPSHVYDAAFSHRYREASTDA